MATFSPPVTQQEFRQPVPCTHQILPGVLPGPHQIPGGLPHEPTEPAPRRSHPASTVGPDATKPVGPASYVDIDGPAENSPPPEHRQVHTRTADAQPYKHSDNAHVEHKNGTVVRREAFRYRYESAEEMELLNELWHLVNLRKNYLLPTVKAVGWRETKAGRKARIYDKPATPQQRLLAYGTLDRDDIAELDAVAKPSAHQPSFSRQALRGLRRGGGESQRALGRSAPGRRAFHFLGCE